MTSRQMITGLAVISALAGAALDPAARQDKEGNYILENRFIRAKITGADTYDLTARALPK